MNIELKKLGSFSIMKYGRMPDKNKVKDSGKYPVYSGYRIVGYSDDYNLTDSELIVIARGVGGTGDVKLSPPFCFLTNLSIAVILDEKVALKKYLYYYFLMNNLRYLDSGSAQSQITISDLQNVEIPIPMIDIQHKIVSILSCFDDKIELNNKINANLQQQAQAIFKSWFVDDEKSAHLRQINLFELCKTITKGTTPTTIGKKFTRDGIRFIKAENVLSDHRIDLSKLSYIDNETNSILKRSILQSGDIVFTIAGTLGRFAFIDDSVIPANTNQAVAIIRTDKCKVPPEYIYSFFLGGWHTEYYTKHIQQAVQANLSLATIKSLPILILNEADMKQYIGVIKPIISKIIGISIENRKLVELRNTILPKLMSGEIDNFDVKI